MKRSNRGRSLAGAIVLAILCSACGAWAETAGGQVAGSGGTLHAAAERNDIETMAALIAGGADLDAEDDRGLSPLHLAATRNGYEAVELLLDHGTEIDPIAERKGVRHTPLMAAVAAGSTEAAVLLISRGADVNVKDEHFESSLLHLAAGHDGHEFVPLLIEHGVDIDVRDLHGRTPLHDAAESDDREAALALIGQGADVDARDGGDKTPLHRAAAAWEGAPRTAALLVDHGASVDTKDPAGWTPLHHALVGQAPRDVAGMLIDRGADAGAATALAGWTPLHLAAHLNDPGLVAALLARGAPVNARTRIGGWTPLHLALRLEGADEVAAMLRAAGAEDRTHDVAAFPPVWSSGNLLYSSGEFVFDRNRKLRTSETYAIPSADFFGGGGGRPAARGSFTAPGARERLVFERLGFAPYLDDHAEAVGLVDESGAARVLWITDRRYPFETLCRDPLTGLHHAIFKRAYGGSGNPGDVVHMYYDPERGTLVDGLVEAAYLEWYEDGVSSRSSASPTAAGECRWRAKKAAIETWVDALDALRVGALAEWGAAGGEPIVLPTRVIPSPVAESSLDELQNTPPDVGSVSTGLIIVRDLEEDRRWIVESPRWAVFVASGARAGDDRYHDGVVLVRDKARDEWRSIHDCRGIDVRNVRGNTLFADFFDNCEVHAGDWTGHTRHHFKVDLLTWTAQRVEGWEPCEAPATLEERERCRNEHYFASVYECDKAPAILERRRRCKPVSVPCPDWMDTYGYGNNTCKLDESGLLGGGTVIYRNYTYRSDLYGRLGTGIEIAHADRPDRPFLKLDRDSMYYFRPSYAANREAGVEFLHVLGRTDGTGSYPHDHVLVREHGHGPWLDVREEYLGELEEFVTRELGEYTTSLRPFSCYTFRPDVDFRTLEGSSWIDDDCDCNACGDGLVEFRLRLVHGASGPALVLKETPRIRPE